MSSFGGQAWYGFIVSSALPAQTGHSNMVLAYTRDLPPLPLMLRTPVTAVSGISLRVREGLNLRPRYRALRVPATGAHLAVQGVLCTAE